MIVFFFFSSRRRHTRFDCDWSSDVCSSDLGVRPAVAALVRDPRSSMQIWSRHQGYPGDEWYLEFHKIRWPGGLKLWRVTGANVDLGGKRPYEPSAAHERAMGHASHFVHLLQSLAQQQA